MRFVCLAGGLLFGFVALRVTTGQAAAAPPAAPPPAIPATFNTPREMEIVPSNGELRTITIVNWNIERGRELPTIAAELAHEPVQLCLLQEVDWGTKRVEGNDVSVQLARKLDLNLAYGVEFEELGQEINDHPAYIGQATLTVLPILKARILRFKHQSDFWKPRPWVPALPIMQRRQGGRIALITELQFANRPLIVYNVHLESRSLGKIQMEQLDEIFADMKRYPPNTAIVFAGDLNTKYFPSTFLQKIEQQGFHSAMGQRIERTHEFAMSLDWIFARGPIKIQAGRVQRKFKGSDHFPIYAQLIAQ